MEEWKTVVVNGEVYNNYMVSNLGNVKSLYDNRHKIYREKKLKLGKNKKNYLCVVLCKDGKRKTYYVHKLVAEAFIPKIPGKEFVDHIDGNPSNNVYTNLRYCTHKENCNFELCKKHHSESQKGEKNSMYGKTGALCPNSKVVLCVELNKIFGSTMEIEKELGINKSSIGACCRGERKSAGGYHWKYIDE